VRIYDGKSGKLLRQLVPNENVGWSGAQFSPDGAKVVSWGTGNTKAYVWETATGRQLFTLEGHQKAVGVAAFSPDGKRIVTGSADHTLRLWDASTGKEQLVLTGHTADCGACFAPDGKRIVSYSSDRTIRCWDAMTGQAIWKQTEHAGHAVTGRSFSPDGLIVSLGSDGSVRILDADTGKLKVSVKSPAAAHGAAFIQDGKRLAWWAPDKALRVWDVAGGRIVRTVKLGDDLQHEPDNVIVSADGSTLLTGHTNQTVRVRDLAWGIELCRFATAPQTGTRSLALSPDNRYAAAGSFRGWVYLWRLPMKRIELP
jgi:WD40 repeat protein